MDTLSDLNDKRAHQRFKTIPRALVLVNRGPETLPFHIIDISSGGLSFRYLGKRLKNSEISEISLFHDFELQADKIPAKIVSDFRLHNNLVPVRRGSISFEAMSNDQKSQLESFIENYSQTDSIPT